MKKEIRRNKNILYSFAPHLERKTCIQMSTLLIYCEQTPHRTSLPVVLKLPFYPAEKAFHI